MGGWLLTPFNCSTIQLQYNSIAIQFNCNTIQLQYNSIAIQFHCNIIPLQCYSVGIQFNDKKNLMKNICILHESSGSDGGVVSVGGVEFAHQSDIIYRQLGVQVGLTGSHLQESEGVVHSLDPSGFGLSRQFTSHLLFQNFVEDSQSFLFISHKS